MIAFVQVWYFHCSNPLSVGVTGFIHGLLICFDHSSARRFKTGFLASLTLFSTLLSGIAEVLLLMPG